MGVTKGYYMKNEYRVTIQNVCKCQVSAYTPREALELCIASNGLVCDIRRSGNQEENAQVELLSGKKKSVLKYILLRKESSMAYVKTNLKLKMVIEDKPLCFLIKAGSLDKMQLIQWLKAGMRLSDATHMRVLPEQLLSTLYDEIETKELLGVFRGCEISDNQSVAIKQVLTIFKKKGYIQGFMPMSSNQILYDITIEV